jgi:hypothetical protein
MNPLKDEDRLSTPDIKGYIKMTEPDDKFPTLSRRGGSNIVSSSPFRLISNSRLTRSFQLSANPDAHDLANARTPGPESYAFHSRYRNSHQSMPQNLTGAMRFEQLTSPAKEDRSTAAHPRHFSRHSLEGGLIFSNERSADARASVSSTRPAGLQSSYSTNDLPTVKGSGFDAAITPPKTNAEHLHQHNASMGRIPTGAISARSAKESPETEIIKGSLPVQTMLQANAAPFGPQLTSATSNNGIASSAAPVGVPFPPLYGYAVQPYVAQPAQATNQIANFGQTNGYAAYPAPAFAANNYRFNDVAARGAVTQRRQTESDAGQATRYANFPIEHYKGDLYSLCKDQHGCRYLQRKLEERNPEHVQLIFAETYMHVIELMTGMLLFLSRLWSRKLTCSLFIYIDPFGNYLCQKLLEYSNDEQRTALIDNAAPQLVKIALNQHGTRALQKMIEFISTAQQTQTVIDALKNHVVELVQDLNGNHVIQKCLNRLNAEEAEFIYEAVGTHCVIVGTHRHGCCVLQRCIDHASGPQKARLIAQITSNSFALVQDPFGNYVVQYILDLADTRFINPLCRTFSGNIPSLSKQKFSSNVIEKCLRTADNSVRREMIDEVLNGNELEKMLRDSFANYVVQTAMDFADADTRQRIVDAIRPILPSIRQTPHGRRIAGKMMAADGSGRSSAQSSGQVTPNEATTSTQIPKHILAKPYSFHSASSSLQTTNGSSGFNGHPFSSGATSPPNAEPSEGTAIYSSPPPPVNGHIGAQGQVYAGYY